MADTLLFRGGSSADIAVSTVQNRELVIDTDTYQIVSGASKKKTVMEDSSGNVAIGAGVELNSDGSSYFSADMGLANRSPNVRLAINIQARGTDGIDFTNSAGNNVYSSIRGVAATSDLYFANRASGKTLYINNGGDVGIGGTLPSSPNITLKGSDGSATFGGDVQSGGDANKGTQDGIRLRSAGFVQCSRASGSAVFTGYTTGDIDATSVIYSDGSADFKGDIEVTPDSGNASLFVNARNANGLESKVSFLTLSPGGGNQGATIRHNGTDQRLYLTGNTASSSKHLGIDSSGNVTIGGTLPSAPSISLNASDGSATFAGDLQVPNAINTATSNDGVHVYANGQVYASRAGSNALWTGKQTAVSGYTSRINADGSAEFAGDVTCTDNSKGLVLKSPDGTSFRLSVANDGTLSATSI